MGADRRHHGRGAGEPQMTLLLDRQCLHAPEVNSCGFVDYLLG